MVYELLGTFPRSAALLAIFFNYILICQLNFTSRSWVTNAYHPQAARTLFPSLLLQLLLHRQIERWREPSLLHQWDQLAPGQFPSVGSSSSQQFLPHCPMQDVSPMVRTSKLRKKNCVISLTRVARPLPFVSTPSSIKSSRDVITALRLCGWSLTLYHKVHLLSTS